MHTFDLRNTIIPFSLLRIIHLFKGMNPGDTIEVLWSDPSMPSDLLKILPADDHEVIMMEEIKGDEHGFRMQLKKLNHEINQRR